MKVALYPHALPVQQAVHKEVADVEC
jgi:hypothetical protein